MKIIDSTTIDLMPDSGSADMVHWTQLILASYLSTLLGRVGGLEASCEVKVRELLGEHVEV